MHANGGSARSPLPQLASIRVHSRFKHLNSCEAELEPMDQPLGLLPNTRRVKAPSVLELGGTAFVRQHMLAGASPASAMDGWAE